MGDLIFLLRQKLNKVTKEKLEEEQSGKKKKKRQQQGEEEDEQQQEEKEVSMIEDLGFFASAMTVVTDDNSTFLKHLDAGIRHWFFDRLKEANGGELGFAERALFDPSTKDGLNRIFKHRDSWPEFKDKIRYVVQGDSKLGLAKMHQSWSRAGFGKWAHINPGYCMRVSKIVRDQISDSLGIECVVSNPSHLIVKPPDGSELKSHHDQLSPIDLLNSLRDHMNSEDTSTTAWVCKHGLQCLAHLEGGYKNSGCTYIVGPMSPRRLLICMEALKNGTVSCPDGWFDAKGGPYFLNWKSLLSSFNSILSQQGEPPLSILPMVPPSSSSSSSSPFFIAWPVGFPHGSSANLFRRVSSTVPLKIVPLPSSDAQEGTSFPQSTPRFLKRAQCFMDLHDSDKKKQKHASDWLSSDTKPYEEGLTHKNPQKALRWVQPGGFYAKLAPQKEDVDALKDAATYTY